MWFIRTVVWLDNNNNNCYISPPLKYQEGASDMTVTCCVNTNLDQLLVILKFCLNQAREASQQGIRQWPAKSSSDKYYYYANYTFTGTFLIAFSNIVFQSTIVASSPVINAKIELRHVRTLFLNIISWFCQMQTLLDRSKLCNGKAWLKCDMISSWWFCHSWRPWGLMLCYVTGKLFAVFEAM